MRDRSLDIFEATVREFIRTGEPVSSSRLYEQYDFGIKPASIRIELTDLTDAGYLEQPHHAAGRVPTDRGFALYADRALAGAHPARESRGLGSALQARAWDELSALLAAQLGTVGIVADLDEGHAYTRGIPSLVDGLEGESREELSGIIRDLEAVAGRIGRYRDRFRPDGPRAFIGKGGPVAGSGALASVAARYDLGDRSLLIVAVGPKRMDYDRAAAIFATVDHLINHP